MKARMRGRQGVDVLQVVAAEAAGGAPVWLTEVVALVLAGAFIAYLCQRAGIVPIVGFLLAGVVIGPNALGLVRSEAAVEQVAEVGVILLLFTIGLEFSVSRLLAIRRLIFGGGLLQVGLVTLASVALLMLAHQPVQVGIYTGFLVALSSTAIVLKLNADRGVTNTPQGQVALGLLLFQDLAVVLMVLLVPVLSGEGQDALDVARALGTAVAVIVGVLVVARRVMPRVLETVARTCSPEVFLLSVVAICLGTAFVTSLAGVSVSLGAFLAGLLVSESRFSDHAFGEVLPLQIVFSAVFFVSVGMLLDVGFLVTNLPLVLVAVLAVVVIKVLTTGLSARLLGYPTPVAAAAAFTLAQVGEFSFVLERAGRELGLAPAGLGDRGSQTFIAASVVLMVATPLLARGGDLFATRAPVRHAGTPAPPEDPDVPPAGPSIDLDDHVIVAGYGAAARMIAEVLDEVRIPHIITTLSPGGEEEAAAAGHRVVLGDATRYRTLSQAGMERAQVLVVADDDPAVAQRVTAVGRTLNPDAEIFVRIRHNAEADALVEAGASYVVTEEHASAAAITEKVLHGYRLPDETIREQVMRLWHRRRHAPRPSGGSREQDAIRARRLSAYGTVVDTERRMVLASDTPGCSHVNTIHPVLPSAPGCEECLELDDSWVHLRVCMFCGHVGCCDSSPNRHASKHHERTDHPIMASAEPGEEWGWCYPDNLML
jgi:monovalent cation:H+ antiporter-2, CPA2 family